MAAPADDVDKCDAGDGEACTRLGVANKPEMDGTRGNAPLALAYFKKACGAKSWKGCTELARLHEYGIGTPEDKAAAAKYFELACSHDYASGCWSRALMYNEWLHGCDPAYHDETTYSRPRDCKGHVVESQNKALDLLRKACELKDEYSCQVVKAYEEKPGPVRIKLDDEFDEDWAFELPEDGEPVWDDFEQK